MLICTDEGPSLKFLGHDIYHLNLRSGNESSSARAKSALATSPFRWALLPCSSLKVSKMPKVPGPTLKANQAVVPTSATTRGVADFRNSSTLVSLQGRALSVARIPTLFMRYLLSSLRFSSFRKVTVEAANADCEEHGCRECP